MPTIYLSPSTQEFNNYLNGGTEEQYMNLLADYMQPYLLSNGIDVVRNSPDMTAASSIRQSNEGNYDLHLAPSLKRRSRISGRSAARSRRLLLPRSGNGHIAAETIAENLKTIYPNPELVNAVPTTSIGEVRRTKAPAVLIELAYHDNPIDEAWIKNNLEEIAINIVQSLTQYFGIPFIPAGG